MAENEKTVKSKKSNTNKGVADLTVGLRMEASLFKLKKFVDNLVDVYSRTTNIEAHEAKDLVSKKAWSYMEKGLYGRAIDEFNRLIGMGKEDAPIYYNMGICCEYEGMDEEAERAYKKVIEVENNHGDAIYRLGLLAIKSDDAATAIKYLSALTDKGNASFDVMYQLGVAYDKKKNYQKAKDSFVKAVASDPKNPKAYKRLGYVFDAIDKHEDAVTCFKKAMELEEI